VTETVVPRRVTWRVATVAGLRDETRSARTLVLNVPEWPGHQPGQHLDVRLTSEDGYTATRSYSIASALDGERVELSVEELPDGEVSPYLTRELATGDQVEVRGPVGGWFVWRPSQQEPVQLVAGGSGVVPLMAMVRTHEQRGAATPMLLLYSVREPGAVLYADELLRRSGAQQGLRVDYAYTRTAPDGWPRSPGRVDAALLEQLALDPDEIPTCYVCGPTSFVEAMADLLVAAGHDPARVRTERFGPSGGPR
jgi:ferredoxin-NADP reductase